ncbi:hypothetical protein BO78DRAFT_466237 [Aspergillus sclerotiicarbonarius CBS 121057]|uniref:Uncharacterized protein n=1 Tax=Aspergillus sclerotiicarbonarius (strain CBS 121057 / IBT 28362) TaxID=1448318 RepID=A0A319FNB3_ASPSB|nr:hypothetical protein BO78DRAFT_466237 [Aspergillus sclerotiicarbonarius CBS 121057]
MSATIHSQVVDLDGFIPRVVSHDREEKDMENLLPWVFQESEIVKEECLDDWPVQDSKFTFFFKELIDYYTEFDPRGPDLAAMSMREEIVLPRKSWAGSKMDPARSMIRSQGLILRLLMLDIYRSLEGVRGQGVEIRFPISASTVKYLIGGDQYGSRPEGEVTVGPRDESLPILSYTGWFKEQTWSEFLGQTLGIMLGQLAKNIRVQRPLQDQEVFVIGFYGPHIHIARGCFPRATISRVHAKGCSDNEVFELEFTRGYNLCRKDDWLEATRALARLFRYLLSGKAEVAAMQAFLPEDVAADV